MSKKKADTKQIVGPAPTPQSEMIPPGSIQAIKFREGEHDIQEVVYSELKPQEKQEVNLNILQYI